jgi:hypothetical protein
MTEDASACSFRAIYIPTVGCSAKTEMKHSPMQRKSINYPVQTRLISSVHVLQYDSLNIKINFYFLLEMKKKTRYISK